MHRLSAFTAKHHKNFLIITTFLTFFYFLFESNSWKYAYVGDVWNFYTFAKKIADHNFQVNLFSFAGVYGMNSVLASAYQAVFLKIFGVSNFSWRLSNIILIIPLSYFFYRWLRLSFDWKTVFISTILLQSSFFLSTFFKIGYINPQALILFIISLYYSALSGLQPTKRNGCILGCTLGLSFYIYIGPIFPFIVWPYLLPLFKNKMKKKIVTFFAVLLVTYLCWLALLLPSISTLHGIKKATLVQREFTDNTQIITNIGDNLLVFYKDFNFIYTHFIPFPYLDLISQLFAFIGTVALIGLIRVKRYRDLLLVYLSTVIVMGIISPYSSPPTSRGIMLVIFGFIFASIGLQTVAKLKFLEGRIIIPAVCCMIFLNIYLNQIGSFAKTDYSGIALIIKEMQNASTEKDKNLVLLLSPKKSMNPYLYDMQTMKEAYGLQNVHFALIRPNKITCEAITNKKLLLFSYDRDAMQWTSKNDCTKNNISIRVLSTKILYY